ncbi:MAG: hypothetical protein ABSF14_06835 [Terriglobia bacterium]|jgi:hypothetical protein
MTWARMLAYITGTVDQELLLRNEYRAAENRILKVQNVAVIKEPTPQPGHTINPRGMPCGGNSEPNWRALASSKSRGPHTAEVRATLPCKRLRQPATSC